MAPEADQPIRWKERIGRVAIGHTSKKFEEIIFDFTLYPAVIAWLGTIEGGLVMTAFSALMCRLYLVFYDWSGKDWFGFEFLKEVRDGEESGDRMWHLAQSLARKSDWLVFIFLSCYMDPFMTTVYMRKGTGAYNGLSQRDWKIFWGSVIVANLWWTTLMTFAVEGVRILLKWLNL
ncbi:MAG: hypothetical protein WAW90_00415 [Minisyncoccia bacterium]